MPLIRNKNVRMGSRPMIKQSTFKPVPEDIRSSWDVLSDVKSEVNICLYSYVG